MTDKRKTSETATAKPSSPQMPPGAKHCYELVSDTIIVERYKVLEPLGFGGFSEVYRCLDLRLEREVALKIIPDERLTKELLLEAQTAASLEHSQIVHVYDVAAPGQEPFYLAMRLLAGGSLEKKLDGTDFHRLPLDEVTLRILTDVALALDHAHSKRVWHRDVKPSNILLDDQGRACLADFGLARVKRLPGESAVSGDAQMSGTIPYMSPEQVNEQPVDHRADIYALGVVAYEVLTGQLPYRGRSSALLVNIAKAEPIPPRLANPEIPEGVEQVLFKVLSKEPEQRYQTCRAFVAALAQASQAYMEVEGLYKQALALAEAKEWRQALAALEQLEEQAPGYKEVRLHLERARKQAQLLNLYAEAEKLLEGEKYQDCLHKLTVIGELDAAFDVASLRERAQRGLAEQQREALDAQYARAAAQFATGEYRACLDTLETIRKQDARYPDREDIEPKARAAWERQQRLLTLYQTGLDKAATEKWEEAIEIFQELHGKEPDYRDVNHQLVVARYLARLSGIYRRATAHFDSCHYAACMDELDELARIDQDYKREEVADLRQRAVAALYQQAKDQLTAEAFTEALETLRALAARAPAHGDPEKVAATARAGMAAQERQKRLEAWYQEAQELLASHEYQVCLARLEAIVAEQEDFPDPLQVAQRAREGLRSRLSQEATQAYYDRQYERAVALWDEARRVAPDSSLPLGLYGDAVKRAKRGRGFRGWLTRLYGRLKPRPKAGVEKKQSRIPRWLWPWGGIIGVVALLVLLSLIPGGPLSFLWRTPTPTPTETTQVLPSPPTLTSTATFTPTPTHTCTATSTATATNTPTRTATPTLTTTATNTPTLTRTSTRIPTATSTATPTGTLMPTPTLPNVAVCIDAAAIFVAPDADSAVLDYVAVGESVTVIGRASRGRWLYIRDRQGVEGFVWLPYFDWPGNLQALPTRRPTVTMTPVTPTRTPTPKETYPPLDMDFWPVAEIPPRCPFGKWFITVLIRGQGGNEVYTYYLDGKYLAGPLTQNPNTSRDELVYTFEVEGTCGAMRIVKGRVESGDGQSFEEDLFLASPDCCQ